MDNRPGDEQDDGPVSEEEDENVSEGEQADDQADRPSQEFSVENEQQPVGIDDPRAVGAVLTYFFSCRQRPRPPGSAGWSA